MDEFFANFRECCKEARPILYGAAAGAFLILSTWIAAGVVWALVEAGLNLAVAIVLVAASALGSGLLVCAAWKTWGRRYSSR